VILRLEPWGAWVKLESMPAVVALDRDAVRRLGVDGSSAWDGASPGPSLPLEVHLAVTGRCGVGCKGCYLDARPDGHEPPREELLRTLDVLAAAGVFTVAFGGGEPTTRGDLDVLARAAQDRGLTPVLTTSGVGLTRGKTERLRSFAQVNVSYDGPGDTYESVRGYDGAAQAEKAIRELAAAGVRVGVNVVLTRASFARLGATVARAAELGAVEAQLLRYKPAGRAATADYLADRLDPGQAASLGPTLRALAAAHPSMTLRIDCALVPFLSADPAIADDPGALARFGVFGCEAGAALAAVKVDGKVAPCSFAPSSALDAGDLARGWAEDPELARWRGFADSPPEPCASCTLRPVCKGGCKVVSAFLARGDGALRPDPECPRVRAHARGAGA
jgi:radical SAM protein with 4Fe4S-binding SPASM domain